VITATGFSTLCGNPADPIRTATSTVGTPIKAGKASWAVAVTPDRKTV